MRPRRPKFGYSTARSLATPAALHLSFALLCRFAFGVEMEGDPQLAWDRFWQTLPLAALREALLPNVFALHGQPPLHNLMVGVLAKLSDQPLALLHALYIALGALMTSMASALVVTGTDSPRLGLALGCALALHPGLVLYEAYPLYTLPTGFLVLAALCALSRFQRVRRERWLLLFLVALTLLVLLRSLYHVGLLVVGIATATWLAERRRRVFALGLLIALPALGWSARNLVVYGAPGGSSWAGCNLWKIASARHSVDSLRQLAETGAVSPVVLRVPVFSPPAAYRPYGFQRRSGVPALDRNDHHNANIPAICALYGRSAVRLIAHDPLHYAGNVWLAYRQFTRASSAHRHLARNAARIGPYASWFATGPLRNVFFLLVPLAILLPTWRLFAAPSQARVALRARPLLPFAALLIAYTALVGSAADLGENERFKFPIELPVLCVLVTSLHTLWRTRSPRMLEAQASTGERG